MRYAHCYSLSWKLECVFAELFVQLCTFYWSKETGKSEWVRFFMCVAYKKHVKHAQVEPDLSSSVLERQSQTNIQSVSQRSPINLQIGL